MNKWKFYKISYSLKEFNQLQVILVHVLFFSIVLLWRNL